MVPHLLVLGSRVGILVLGSKVGMCGCVCVCVGPWGREGAAKERDRVREKEEKVREKMRVTCLREKEEGHVAGKG